MSSLSCCVWWLLAGLLLGWLASWLFNKWFGRTEISHVGSGHGGAGSGGAAAFASSNATTSPASAKSVAASVATPVIAPAPDYAAAASLGFVLKKRDGLDDLEIIEGIGPKICDLLHTNGVKTFKQLAGMSVAEINAVLEKGGDRFRLANPASWAEQSSLCANNRWAELKTLQDSLVAGVAAKPNTL